MIMVTLAIFQALIWVGACLGKFLIGVGVRSSLDAKLHGLGTC
jgi:hypothetical protein